MFQSSPVPKDGCNLSAKSRSISESSFNPHPSRRTGATGAKWYLLLEQWVSILTRPEGRVQRARACASAAGQRFQSSPVPKDGCNLEPNTQTDVEVFRFNPHPSRRTGATSLVCRALCVCGRSYNPHPSRRTGATWYMVPKRIGQHEVSILTRPEGRVQLPTGETGFRDGMFQSSPVPKDGCNTLEALLQASTQVVSILTRPEGRVQPVHNGTEPLSDWVSILTRPEGRVQHHYRPAIPQRISGFNPHPSRRTGATYQLITVNRLPCVFQSSPVPKDGCNATRHYRK